ncbi:MAG: diguanylate cyclase [Gammaproteobacteria bacterium]|nr:diguanylate cyclase [Gammaproteobacteria bacterium]
MFRLAVRFQKAIENPAFVFKDPTGMNDVTISTGFCTMNSGEITKAEELILQVDKAMYRAKPGGVRHRVVEV